MKRIAPFVILSLMMLSLAACGPTEGTSDQDIAQAVAATQTKLAWESSVDAAQQAEQAVEPTQEPESPPPTQQPEVVHQSFPEDTHKELANTYLTDFNSIDYAEEGITYGDQFFINRYERPFTVEMGEYRSYLDITLAEMFVTPPWIYVDVYFSDALPETSSAVYSLELDLDVDGRGDYLIQAALPPDAAWTVGGVEVLADANKDVGGEQPQLMEGLSPDLVGDGFETVVFSSGAGEDPDLAWVRRSAEDPTMLQFAFKSDLTGNTGFLWSVWADDGLQDPGMRDYNDRFTFQQAGSPYPEHEFYPIEEINLLDSTCRSWYGFEPQGSEVGICQVYTPGTGYKVCTTYNLGARSITRCDSVCQEKCPAGIPYSISGLSVTCQKCTMPEPQ